MVFEQGIERCDMTNEDRVGKTLALPTNALYACACMTDNLPQAKMDSTARCQGGHFTTESRDARPRLNKRLLMLTWVVAPAPFADAFVSRGLLSQFDIDEVVVAAERTWANRNDQTHEPNGHPVHFIGAMWTWPKRGQRFIHWMKWFLVPRTAYRLIKLAKSTNCRAVFGHFPDEHCLCAAFLAARCLGLKFFAYFHNTYRENRSGISYLLAGWLQRRIFEGADAVFVMSEGMKEALHTLYPAVEFRPLVHTFDGPVTEFQPLPPIDRSRVRLGYLGSINQANLDALRRVAELVKASNDLELNIYSSAPDWQLKSEGLVGERIQRRQPADDELHDVLRHNDILVLPHGLTGGLAPIEYQTIFPTRTIPYLLSGRPILAHSARDSFLSNWLRRHDCAELVEVADSAALREAVNRLCMDAARREQLVRNALAAANQFRAAGVVDQMKRAINRLLSNDGIHSDHAEL
jgi:glycosyltransferase involved in cell wall biosynthesis